MVPQPTAEAHEETDIFSAKSSLVPESLADLLHRFRSVARLSQEALAERAAVSTRTVSDIETGFAKTPRLVTIVLLAEALGLGDADRGALQDAARKTAPRRRPYQDGQAPLPAAPALVGRDADVAAAVALLVRPGVRLVTLCGPAGVGKTSLALRIASECRDRFAAGAAFVELASIADPALVPAALAHALGVRESEDAVAGQAVIARLRGRAMLLVFDNFEHLTPAAAWLAQLLEGAADLKVLATSREALRLRAEHTFAVKPLDEAAATALFVARAQAVEPGFCPTAKNGVAIKTIVQRLEGLPLAIELAAPRLRLLPPKALAARLERRLPMLGEGAVDLPARQQTMHAAIRWSYDLLSAQEQQMFRRLAVLRGGGTLEAARSIAGEAEAATFLVHIAALVEKSLLSLEEDAEGEPRLAILEMLREFALEQSAEDELHALRDRHADFFLAFAEGAGKELTGMHQAAWLTRIDLERPNLLAALAWFAQTGNGRAGLRLAVALARFWWLRGLLLEGRMWLVDFLAHSDAEPQLRARALRGLVILQSALGNFDDALGPCEEAIALQRASGDEVGLGGSLTSLGIIMQFRDDLARAKAAHEEGLAIRRRIGDDLGVATSLSNLASVALTHGKLNDAARFGEESMTIYRRLGNASGMSHALLKLGMVASRQQEYDRAERLFDESLALQRSIGNVGSMFYSLSNLGMVAYKRGDLTLSMGRYKAALELLDAVPNKTAIAEALEGVAAAVTAVGEPHRAARIFGAAHALRTAIGSPVLPGERVDYEAAIAATRAALANDAFALEWQIGSIMPLERAIDEARGASAPSPV